MVMSILLSCMAALLPSLLLFFENMQELPITYMLPYFAAMIGLGIILWLIVYLITRKKALSGLIAAASLLLLLNVGRVVPALQSAFPLLGLKVILPVCLIILALIVWGLSKLSEEHQREAVTIVTLGLAALFLASFVTSLINPKKSDDSVETAASENEKTVTVSADEGKLWEYPFTAEDLLPAEGKDRPNIYWILSDEYAGLDELNKYYHYDNSPFYNDLREMGFTVSDHSHNWRSSTYRIIEDILGFKYHENSDQNLQKKRIADPDAPLWAMLRNLGYEIYEAESSKKFNLIDRLNGTADDSSPATIEGSAVINLLLRYSILYRYENEIANKLQPLTNQGDEKTRKAILSVFEWAENSDNHRPDKPSCTAIYIACPHAPYIFDENGNRLPVEQRRNTIDKQYYLNQLIFFSKHVKKMCEAILAADPNAIIVLQSDHGQRLVPNVTQYDSTNIINAVYFKGESIEEIVGKNGLNTWITVLNRQFGLSIPEVEERYMGNDYRVNQRNPDLEDPNVQ